MALRLVKISTTDLGTGARDRVFCRPSRPRPRSQAVIYARSSRRGRRASRCDGEMTVIRRRREDGARITVNRRSFVARPIIAKRRECHCSAATTPRVRSRTASRPGWTIIISTRVRVGRVFIRTPKEERENSRGELRDERFVIASRRRSRSDS